MPGAASLFWTAVLLALSSTAIRAQQSTLSNIELTPCCIAPDRHGNNFIVSTSQLPVGSTELPTISVAKTDSTGNVVSQFAFQPAAYGRPAAAAVDPNGNLWIGGWTYSGAGLIAELDSSGAHLLYTGTFGGLDPNGYSHINAMAFDPAGNLYLGGYTGQADFPLTTGSFLSQFGAAGCPLNGAVYGFIAKLTPGNQATPPYVLVWSTLLGGRQFPPVRCGLPATTVSALAVDANGVVTAAGQTQEPDFPVTPGAFQTQYDQPNGYAFITRLNAQGTGLIWSTLLGAPATAEIFDNMQVSGLAEDSSGNVVLTGTTIAPSLPVTAGALQPQFANPAGYPAGPVNGFVAKLNSTGSGLLFSTYYGIANNLSPPRLDAQGDIWITGSVADRSGPVLRPNSLVLGGSLIAELAPDGSTVLFSELLSNGVAGQDLVLNPDGSLTVTGPSAAGQLNLPSGFVLRLPRGIPTGVSVLGVADSAVNAVTGTVAPGEFLSIYGTGLGPPAVGALVFFDGIPAPVLYASNSQINVLVPYEIADSEQMSLQISTVAGSSSTGPLQVVPANPGVFVVLNADGSVNSPSNLAAPASLVSIFGSGAGELNPPLPDGTVAGSPAPVPALAVQVNFSCLAGGHFPGGRTVTPIYAGGIPGTLVNLLRVDVNVPAGCGSLTVQVGGSNSPSFPVYASAGP